MRCMYCKNEMDLDSQGVDNGVQFHCFACPICSAIMEFEDELDDGLLVYVCPECYHNFIINPGNDR